MFKNKSSFCLFSSSIKPFSSSSFSSIANVSLVHTDSTTNSRFISTNRLQLVEFAGYIESKQDNDLVRLIIAFVKMTFFSFLRDRSDSGDRRRDRSRSPRGGNDRKSDSKRRDERNSHSHKNSSNIKKRNNQKQYSLIQFKYIVFKK